MLKHTQVKDYSSAITIKTLSCYVVRLHKHKAKKYKCMRTAYVNTHFAALSPISKQPAFLKSPHYQAKQNLKAL